VEHIRHGVDLLLAYVPPSANMPDDILGAKNIMVEERELPNAGHCELERNGGAAGATARDKNVDVRKTFDVKQPFYALECPVLGHGDVIPSGQSPVLRHLA
jgi:hypothetical protein